MKSITKKVDFFLLHDSRISIGLSILNKDIGVYKKRYVHYVTFRIKWKDLEEKSPIQLCDCGQRFIEIQEEKNLGYKREHCPFCMPYILVRYAWKYLGCKGKESIKC